MIHIYYNFLIDFRQSDSMNSVFSNSVDMHAGTGQDSTDFFLINEETSSPTDILGLNYYDYEKRLGQNWTESLGPGLNIPDSSETAKVDISNTVKTVTNTQCQLTGGQGRSG